MTRPTLSVALALTLMSAGVAGCAPAARPLQIQPGRAPAVSQFADVRLPQGTDVIVRLMNGESIRGRVKEVQATALDLIVRTDGDVMLRTIAESDIQTVARVVALSKGARTRLGALIGAAVTLPFGISMKGDMIMPGAIVGAFIGRASGDSRGEIVYERPARPR